MYFKAIVFAIIYMLSTQNGYSTYKVEWESPTLEAADKDPWKHSLLSQLPTDFVTHLKEKNRQYFSSNEEVLASLQMINSQGQVRDELSPNIIGSFVYNPRLIIGSGEEGTVYIAQHVLTGRYASLKKTSRKGEYEAFKNLERCYACYSEKNNYYSSTYHIFRPLVIGLPLITFTYDQEKLGMIRSYDKIVYKDWKYNISLVDAFLTEFEYNIKHSAGPYEVDSNAMFLIEEPEKKPCIVFVDLNSEQYNKNDNDLVTTQFFYVMLRFLKFEMTAETLAYPEPIKQFIKEIFHKDDLFVSFTKVKEARNKLVENMKNLGYPEIAKI
ncbi:MAG: hypothetical protein BGO77_01350 [Caedibacter sp. 37-49]|nr:MAG: hypothetical protein BGO77_01350 [Caedibacter sp. 37-49]